MIKNCFAFESKVTNMVISELVMSSSFSQEAKEHIDALAGGTFMLNAENA
jgi:hypothetical protein